MAFQVRVLKSEQVDLKGQPYLIHYVSNNSTFIPTKRYVVSIDPGIKNFSMRIEMINGIQIVPVCYFVTSFADVQLEHRYNAIIDLLNKYTEFFDLTTCVIIESQLHVNYKSLRLSQHLITYFLLRMRFNQCACIIFEVSSKLKRKIFNGPKGKIELKKWSSIKAREIFIEEHDQWSINIIDSAKKKDDLGDVKLQKEALKKQLIKEFKTNLLAYM